MKKALVSYNASDCVKTLQFDDIKDPTCDVYNGITAETTDTTPRAIRRQLVKLWNLKERAGEEETLVQQEMQRLINFYAGEVHKINQLIQTADTTSLLNSGLVSVLKQKKVVYVNKISALTELWSGFVNLVGDVQPVRGYVCYGDLQLENASQDDDDITYKEEDMELSSEMEEDDSEGESS